MKAVFSDLVTVKIILCKMSTPKREDYDLCISLREVSK